MTSIDLNYLISELPPYMKEILGKAGPDVASDLISKGMETLVRGAGRGARSIAVSLRERLRSSSESKKALTSFTAAWARAGDEPQREAAIRELLEASPQFASSVSTLIQRRDYVFALRDYAAELPIAGLEASVSLDEVYVPLPLFGESTVGDRREVEAAWLAREGNHVVISEAGGGKSSLLRSLAFRETQRMLDDQTAIAFDQLRLPALIHARALLHTVDFASALRSGTTEALATFLRSPLPSDFFAPGANEGHRRWLVLIDGLDEVNEGDRDRLLRIVASHAMRGDSFCFILAARPEALTKALPLEGFDRWSIPPLQEAQRLSLIDRYLTDQKHREAFARNLEPSAFAYIAQRPLFLAMSATLFAGSGELFKRKADLLEHFAQFHCSKVAGSRQVLLKLLGLIATNVDTRSALMSRHRSLVEELVGRASTIAVERELDRLLLRTGLVRSAGGRYHFSHDLFRSYFTALELSERYYPAADTLKTLDPFTIGWETISLLGQLWNARGLDVEPIARALLEFGDGGLRCAVELIAASPSISDVPALRIADRLLSQSRESGPTIMAGELLPMLARERHSVADKLYGELHSDEYIDRTFIAECLLDANLEEEAIDHLLWLAEDEDSYSPDRIHAAELLLKHGYLEEALDAFRDVASSGDEHWAVVEAAMRLYELERTEENKAPLAELLTSDPEPGVSAFMSTFAQLVAMGEAELALPRLRSAASAVDEEDSLFKHREAIAAAVAIGEHHSKNEGKRLLEARLGMATTLDQRADVVHAIAKLGFRKEARTAIRESVALQPLAVDWSSLKLLAELDSIDIAQTALERALEDRLRNPSVRAHEISSLLEHMPNGVDRTRLADILRKHLPDLRNPKLVRCLARVGAIDEARRILKKHLDAPDIGEQIAAARELCMLGEQEIGVRRLREIVRRADISADLRTTAANALEHVGLLRHAAFSFARIANDETVDVGRRTQAAISFDKLLHKRNDLVWHGLMRVLKDKNQRVADRIEAGTALLTIDGDDGYHDIVFPEIEAILDEPITDTDALLVGETLGLRGWRLRQMPRVLSALTSEAAGLSTRLDALWALNYRDRNPEVKPHLRAIASGPDTPAKYAIRAAGILNGSARGPGTLAGLAADSQLPPSWRLAAITEQRPETPSSALLQLARDESISIEQRIKGLDELPHSETALRHKTLTRIAKTNDLTFWEWLKIAKAADSFGLQPLRRKALEGARADTPLSIGERLALAEEYSSLGDEATVRAIVMEMLALPNTTWVHSEDQEEALAFCAPLETAASMRLIQALLLSEQTSWRDVPHLLATLAAYTTQVEARAFAKPLLLELSTSIREADIEDFGWPEIAAKLIKTGWFDDYETLLPLAIREGRWVGERVHACGLVLKYAPMSSPSWSVAEAVLEKLRCDDAISESDRIYTARRLRSLGLEREAKLFLKADAGDEPDDSADPLGRARLLDDLGRRPEAEAFLRSADPDALFSGFLFERDQELLQSALGDDFVESRRREKVLSNDDPFEQLWRAADIVGETGDRVLVRLLGSRAMDRVADPDERLEAIGCLEQLGFRKLSRDLLASLDLGELDPARAASQLISSGRKADAVTMLSQSHARCDDEDYLLKVMSELGLQ
ncbi:MAG: hypothetical protein JWM33_1441 [Caulobacteraceae bacterium]|nr:hypothetical protein [Caulobacteraceae bacterium]